MILFDQLLVLSLTDSNQNTMAVSQIVQLIVLLMALNIVKTLGKDSSNNLLDIWIKQHLDHVSLSLHDIFKILKFKHFKMPF